MAARKRERSANNNSEQSIPRIKFKARTAAQQACIDLYNENDVLFILGPAGCGKSQISVYLAVCDILAMIKTRRVDKIYLTRPICESTERLGFLPGDISTKYLPSLQAVFACFSKVIDQPGEFINEYVELAPLALMRGMTHEFSTTILDESENCTDAQLKLVATRLALGSKLIINGDLEQSDIPHQSTLGKVVDALEGTKGIGVFRFENKDIVRHSLVGEMLKRWPR